MSVRLTGPTTRLEMAGLRRTRAGFLLLIGAVALGGALAVVAGAAPPPAFAATAEVGPESHYVGDAAGSLYSFTVNNTGASTPIGAVEITLPSTAGWTVIGCPGMPSGWSAQRATQKCRFRSAAGASDDIMPGQSRTFTVLARTAPGSNDRTGTWSVVISKSNQFDTKSLLKNATPTGRGLATPIYTFEITDVVVSATTPAANTACPAANREAVVGATVTLVACGRNHATIALTPTSAFSSLGGTFATGGTFGSGSIPANSGNVVLARWAGATVGSYGLDKTVVVKVGSASNRTSGLQTLTGYSATSEPPDANNDGYDVDEDDQLVVPVLTGVLANDTDAEFDPLSAGNASDPPNGSVTLNADGSFTYDPDDDFNGIDTFTYTANDGHSDSAPATVTITVHPVNDAPEAADDTPSTDEDTALTAVDVLGNDTDIDLDTLVVSAVDDTGTLGTVTNGGSVGYDPDGAFESLGTGETATDTFTYTASDGNGGTDSATVQVTITGVNDLPVASDDTPSTDEDTSVVVNVLGNDTDPEGALTVTAVDDTGTNGTVNITGSGTTVTYDPDGQYEVLGNGDAGSDSFTYTVTDDEGATAVATVNLTINGVNDAPDGVDDVAETDEDTALTAVDVLVNDTDVDSTPLSVSAVDVTTTLGSVTTDGSTVDYDPDGAFDYLTEGEQATDEFTYTVSDGDGGTATATVEVTITGVNDVPIATNKSHSAIGNTLLTVGTTSSSPHKSTTSDQLLDGATDPDDTVLTATAGAVATANSGTATINSDGTFSYLPPQGFTGSDSFSFTVSDPHGATSAAKTVTIAVTDRVWYVEAAAAVDGDGRSTSPFKTIGHLTTGGDADAKDGTGDYLFLYDGAYTGGLVLETSQRLYGEPNGLTVGVVPLVTPGGSNPTIANNSGTGDAVTLANGVDVQRVSVAASSGAGFIGSSITDATVGGNTSVTNAAGGGIVLHDPASGTISIGASVTNTSGRAASVSGRSGGTVTLSGAMTTSNGGVNVSGNTGATVTLSGTLHLTGTGTTKGLSATGGGTVVVTGTDNTVSTETGRAVEVTGTTIGVGGVNFKSVSAGTASAGPDSGIVLNDTGATAGLTVTGTPSTADSGGTIQKTTSHAISLTSTDAVSLNWIKVLNPSHAGVKGVGVTGFTLTRSTVSGAGAAQNDQTDYALAFNTTSSPPNNNLDGVVTITNNTLSGAYGGGLQVSQSTGTITDATISNNTVSSSTDPAFSKGSGIALDFVGTSTTVANLTKAAISSNTVTNFPSGDGIRVLGGNTATSGAPSGTYGTPGSLTNRVVIDGNVVQGDATTKMNGMGITAAIAGRGQGNVAITNNGTVALPITHIRGSGIGVGIAGNVTADFTVTGNRINGTDNVAASSALAIGSDKNIQADLNVLASPVMKVDVSNNTITGSTGLGIDNLNRDSNGTTSLKILNNTVNGALTDGSVSVSSGSSGDPAYNFTVCANINGNTLAAGAPDAFADAEPGIQIYKRSALSTPYVFGLTGLSPSPTTKANAENLLATNNPGSAFGAGFFAGKRAVVRDGDNFTSCTLTF